MAAAKASPFEDDSLTLTIKFDKGYDAPWLVLRGSDAVMRDRLVQHFGLDAKAYEEVSTHDLFLEIDKLAKATYAVAGQLGGKTLKKSETPKVEPTSEEKFDASTLSDNGGEAAEATPAEDPLVAQIAAQGSVEDLQKLWAENMAAFKDGDLLAAWKARGKALSAA